MLKAMLCVDRQWLAVGGLQRKPLWEEGSVSLVPNPLHSTAEPSSETGGASEKTLGKRQNS